MNPILPFQYFIPDVEAHVWPDGRLYGYGSQDISGNHSYCSDTYRVFSTGDMLSWQDHGISLRSCGDSSDTPWSTADLYAPDCAHLDGKYYLFFCQQDRSQAVAVSDSPTGPFTDATTLPIVHEDAIDPAVFVDDDRQAYLYWGQYSLRAARLNHNMRSIDESTLNTRLMNEEEHGFHEGACMRKRGDTYYLVYCDSARGKATCLSYARSNSPIGPFEKGGVIIDNSGCDPDNWNNHGSIVEFLGQWYVFYHRSSQGSNFNRRVCVEKIEFDDLGHIAEVEMTTQGAEDPISASRAIDASRACLLQGTVRGEPIPGEDGCEQLARAKRGDWACYKYLDFGGGVSRFHARVATNTLGGQLKIRIDAPDGPLLGTLRVKNTGGWLDWQDLSCDIGEVTGVHALYIVFDRTESQRSRMQVCNLARFSFA